MKRHLAGLALAGVGLLAVVFGMTEPARAQDLGLSEPASTLSDMSQPLPSPGAAEPGIESLPLPPVQPDAAVSPQAPSALLVPTPPNAQGQIQWRVENPFRLFSDPQHTEIHRATYNSLTEAEKLEPILSAERRLMQDYSRGWASEIYAATCWRPSANRYGPCPNGEDYVNPDKHRVIATLTGPETSNAVCTWIVTAKQTGPQQQSFLQPCAEPIALDIPYPAGAYVAVMTSTQPEAVAETEIAVEDVFIAGMGDSFAAGEGNPDKPAEFSPTRYVSYGQAPDGTPLDGYPARLGEWTEIGEPAFLDAGPRWLSQACHRSLYSYQTRVALQLAVEDPHRAVTFVSFACAGAEVTYGLLLRYKGTEWAPDQPAKPQVSAIAQAQCGLTPTQEKNYQTTYSLSGKLPDLENIVLATCPRDKARKIDLLLLSIGGNDVGFARLVANTMLANAGTLRKLSGWMGQVQSAEDLIATIPELELRYKALNRAIRLHLQMSWTESDRIILTSYPVMALQNTNGGVCPDGQTGMEVFPEFSLSQAKAAASERAAEVLHTRMRSIAKSFAWSFVERHRRDFAGHGVCSGTLDSSINLGDEMRIPRWNGSAWEPFNPAEYQAYVQRQRWYRTPNDAYMTGNYHIAAKVVKSIMSFQQWEYFQLVLASTYSGAFHPTSEGQAVMADATLQRARTVLKRYQARDRVQLLGQTDR